MEPASAFGTLIKIGDGASSESFNTIQGVRSIDGPSLGLDMIDTTHHSTAGNYRSVKPSFLNGGEVAFDLLYDSTDTQHTLLMTSFEGRTKKNFQIVFTDAGAEQWAFAAYISSMAPSAPLDDALVLRVTLSVDQAITRS